MKKIMTNEEKINEINYERKIMLSNIKNNLNNSNNLTIDSISELMEYVSFDEKNTKEYKTILEVKDMIVNLTKLIVEAKTPDEIADIRKNINSCINKIKRILQKRGVTSSEIEKMSDNVNYMRKDISEYIRFLKRENNISEIVRLNDNFNNLSDEDKKKLKTLLKNELNYIRKKKITIIDKEDHCAKQKSYLDIMEEINSSLLINNETDELKEIIEEFKNNGESSLEEKLKNGRESLKQINKEVNYVDSFESLSDDYGIRKLHVFGSSFGRNCIRLIKNIPSYIINNKKVDKMLYDYNTYYSGKDLGLFIKYTKENNSIVHAIGSIFKNSKLFKREKECLNAHDECVNWINNYLLQDSKRVLSR